MASLKTREYVRWLALQPCAVSCNIDSALQSINDAYECAEKVGLSWWARY
jgi:hypothetical protein